MQREIKKYLFDIQSSIENVEGLLENQNHSKTLEII